jgi:hypothetical protein
MPSALRLRLPGIINGLLALWLILGSFLAGFGNVPSKVSDVIIGFFLIFMSMHRSIPSDESRWMFLFSGMLGLAAIVAPWVFSYSDVSSAMINNIIVGAAVLLVSAVGYMMMREPAPQH